MRVTELLMRPGGWSMDLLPSAPPSIVNAVRAALATYDSTNERWTPVMDGQIVVFDTDLREPSLERARYTGILDAQNGDRSFSGPGIAAYFETDDGIGYLYPGWITTPNWTLYEALEFFAVGGVTPGTAYTGGSSTIDLVGPVGIREFSDAHADRLGEEYRINPDLSIDTGAPEDGLFVTDPVVLVDARTGGQYGGIRRINGSATAMTIDCSQVTSLVNAYGAGGFQYTSLTEPTVARAPNGLAWKRHRAIDLPGATDADAAAAAQSTLNLFQYPRSSFDVESDDRYVRRYVQPGDFVFVHFPDAGIKSANPLSIGAETVFPQKVRVHEINWGVHEGHGVYLRRHNGSTESWLRLTPYVQFSDSTSSWRVGTTRGELDAATLQGGVRLGTAQVAPPPPAASGFSINGPATAGAGANRGLVGAVATAPAVRSAPASTPAPYTAARRGG